MTTLAGLIQSLFEHLRSLWPFDVVDPWEQGVRLLFGRQHGEVLTSTNGIRGSGLHWFFPFVGRIVVSECNVEVFETLPQTVRCGSGEDVTFTLGVQARIKRLDLYFSAVNDSLKATVGDTVRVAAGELAAVAPLGALGTDWAEQVRALAQKRMHGWGAEVVRVGLITCCTSPALRLIQGHSATNDLPDIVGIV